MWPWTTLVLGIINVPALAAAFAVGNSTDSDAIRTGAGVVGVVALPLIFAGTLGAIIVWRRKRKVRSVQRYPWVPYPVRYFRSPANEYVQLLDADGAVLSTLLLSTWGWEVGKVANASTREVWFAGDPHRHGCCRNPAAVSCATPPIHDLQQQPSSPATIANQVASRQATPRTRQPTAQCTMTRIGQR